MQNPFQPKSRRRKPRTDKTFSDGRQRLADKSQLREQVFERSGGKCEESKIEWDHPNNGVGIARTVRCNARLSLQSMELSHKRHGCHRDDSLAGTIASCKDCHREKHASKGVPRRPGKTMNITDARVYWESNTCFCDGDKKPKESFCGDCRPKVQPQTMYTLENTDDPPIYREALANAELEILMYGKN